MKPGTVILCMSFTADAGIIACGAVDLYHRHWIQGALCLVISAACLLLKLKFLALWR